MPDAPECDPALKRYPCCIRHDFIAGAGQQGDGPLPAVPDGTRLAELFAASGPARVPGDWHMTASRQISVCAALRLCRRPHVTERSRAEAISAPSFAQV